MAMTDTIQPLITALGVFAALSYLKSGKHEAIRYALILIPATFLLYLLKSPHFSSRSSYNLYLHLIHHVPVILFLLGYYMIKCPWRRIIPAIGMCYTVVTLGKNILNFILQFVLPAEGETAYYPALYLFSPLADICFAWLFVWLAARKHGIKKSVGFLTAAAILSCGAYLSTYINYLDYYFLIHSYTSLSIISICQIVVHIIVFTLVMHYTLQVSAKRSVFFGILNSLPSILFFIYAHTMLRTEFL